MSLLQERNIPNIQRGEMGDGRWKFIDDRDTGVEWLRGLPLITDSCGMVVAMAV